MSFTFKTLARGVLVAALSAWLAGCGVNDIPAYEEAAKAAWAQVENQYQRRADLVPNLVETVRAYAAHERETLQAVVDARSRVGQVQLSPDQLSDPEAFKRFEEMQRGLTGALSRLLVVVEQYPDLKANQNFATLQAQLEGTENRISVARRDFIQAVQRYNTELRTFPGRIWAQILYADARPMQTFTSEPSTAQAPRVNFGTRP
ncbi:MAG: LemA family protein [Alphaproteobacteria bacterium]|nr:LemA family protein [Alphaproteobacteria bacterium]